MKYLKYTYVDALTKKSIHEEPSIMGQVMPEIEGLTFDFALESQYPTNEPVFYGTASDDVDPAFGGVIEIISEDTYNADRETEMAARAEIAKAQQLKMIAGVRSNREIAGFTYGKWFIDTSAESYAKILGTLSGAKNGLRKDGDVWKCADAETGEVIYPPVTVDEMIKICESAYDYVQGCFNREADLVKAVKEGTFEMSMLNEGWPAQTIN